jgi:CheY-like chemotaxis protein
VLFKALRWYSPELKLECSEAENGMDALQKAQQVKPELIILDFSMPVMNAVEAAKVTARMVRSTFGRNCCIALESYGDVVRWFVLISAVCRKRNSTNCSANLS